MDAVQKVGNGHPGTAMSLAPAAYLLFQKVMRHNPADPHWPGRDRFVLSCGHSSLTLYIQLYLGGCGPRARRPQGAAHLGQQDPRPPRVRPHRRRRDHHRPARPGRRQRGRHGDGRPPRARPARPRTPPTGESPFDHHIYALCSDGDIEEGVSAEASSLAGTQQLGNLTLIYDDNQISIEDDTDIAFTEDVAARYEAYGWHVQHVDWTNGGTTEYEEDVPRAVRRDPQGRGGHRPAELHRAAHDHRLAGARHAQNTGKAHGSALGDDEVAATKKVLGFDPDQTFEVADERHRRTPAGWSSAARRPQAEWQRAVRRLGRRNPDAQRRSSTGCATRTLPDGWADALPTLRRRREGHRHPQGLRRGAQRDRRRCCPSCGAARPTWPSPTTPRSRASPVVPARPTGTTKDVAAATRTAGCCTSASASTPWARS